MSAGTKREGRPSRSEAKSRLASGGTVRGVRTRGASLGKPKSPAKTPPLDLAGFKPFRGKSTLAGVVPAYHALWAVFISGKARPDRWHGVGVGRVGPRKPGKKSLSFEEDTRSVLRQ